LASERLYHSDIEHWRAQADNGRLAVTSGEPARSAGGSEGPSLDRVDFGVLSGSPWVDLSNIGSLSGRGGVRRDRW